MRRRTVLAAAAVLVLAALLVWLRQRVDRAARDERRAARLPSFDSRQITGIDLEKGSVTWRLERRATGWRIVAPVSDAADPRAVEGLIRAAGGSPILRSIATPDPPASYGLSPPAARLTFDGVTTPALEIGSVVPTGDAVFARLAGNPAVLVLALPDASPLADVDPSSLRDRSLVDLLRSELVGLAVAPGGLELARDPDGWWITAPRRFPASAVALEQLFGALYGARVSRWDDLDAAPTVDRGLGPTATRVTFRASPSRVQTITLGASAGEGRRFVASEGRGSILIAGPLPPSDAMPLDVARLRDPRLTNVNRYRVSHLVYASGGATLSASRKDDATWITDAGITIPGERIYTLLVALLEAETVSWADGSLDGPLTATLTYAQGDEGASGRLEFSGDRASWDALPGIVFRLASSAPPVPTGPR